MGPTPTTNHPTWDPTIPTLIPTSYPSDLPTINPSFAPSHSPSLPTNTPTFEPTLSPTFIYSDMLFLCEYNDESPTYYSIHIALSLYSELMIDAILQSVQAVTFHSVHYNDSDIWQFAEWTKAGIFDFMICSLFAGDIQLNECNAVSIEWNEYNANAKYYAIATFGIIADKSIENYKEYIMNAMMTDNFMNIFESKMNKALNAYNDDENKFDAVSIQIFDSFNISISNSQFDDSQNVDAKNEESNALIIVFAVFALLLIAIICSLIFYKKQKKENQQSREGKIKNEIEMKQNMNAHQMDLLDNIKNEEFVQNEDDDIMAMINQTNDGQPNDDDVIRSINETDIGLSEDKKALDNHVEGNLNNEDDEGKEDVITQNL